MRIDEVPERLVILGSGYIAAEFAHVFSAFGSRVSMIARSGPLLRDQDETIAERFTGLACDRWDVHLGAEPSGSAGRRVGGHADLVDGTTRPRGRPAGGHGPHPQRRPARPAPGGRPDADRESRVLVDD